MSNRNLLLLFSTTVIQKAWSTVFNGTSTMIAGGTEASIDDLHNAAMTVEMWFKTPLSGSLTLRSMIGKSPGAGGGWMMYYSDGNNLYVSVDCLTTDATITQSINVQDDKWHHVAFTWDNAGDRKIRLFVDGTLIKTSDAGDGAIVSDAAANLKIGEYPPVGGILFFVGNVGWTRISNSIRYTTTFTPPTRITPPDTDANTVRLFKMDEGTGTVITDSSANAQNGTLANGTWIES